MRVEYNKAPMTGEHDYKIVFRKIESTRGGGEKSTLLGTLKVLNGVPHWPDKLRRELKNCNFNIDEHFESAPRTVFKVL